MTPRREFHPLQTVEIANAFQAAHVDYLFLGKGGAILLGFIDGFAGAKARSLNSDNFRVAGVRGIIASKRASNRQKDLLDLRLLEAFREEFERLQSKPLRTAAELASERASRQEP